MSLRLFCAVAHPDDECFAFGGAIALAVDAGHEVFVTCATDGQSGSYRGTANTPEELATLRRAEFAASCAVLGVHGYELLGYVDGQLEFAGFSALAAKLVTRIREFRPDVVLTFGLDGSLNTHPDHTIVACAASAAFHWAASEKRFPYAGPVHRVSRLFQQTTSFFLPDRPAPSPSPWSVALDVTAVLPRKMAAFAAHTTQAPLMEKTRPIFEAHGTREYYTLLASTEPAPVRIQHSLFEGL